MDDQLIKESCNNENIYSSLNPLPSPFISFLLPLLNWSIASTNSCFSVFSLFHGGRLLADSYQYQLQSMWQKCWNTNQSLVHNLRFRERGPLKSWRPETMAEAIFSVLKEGLSLSQAARKYDIPYPTFVLYANRVHNMLGPSADGGADLRPKGRGRPQRILLGVWPDEHIRGVIRAVVFRDGHSPHIVKEEPTTMYPSLANYAACNGPEGAVSPGAAAAAAVAAVAQGNGNIRFSHFFPPFFSPYFFRDQ
ncbi:BAB1 protein, partial [Acromyrmex heyeri]